MEWVIEPEALDWVSERLAPFGAAQVTSLVPTGFEAYARIRQPHRVESAAALVEVLRPHTPQDERCWFAIWEGYGWVWGGMLLLSTDPTQHGHRPRSEELAVPGHIRAGARASRPHRDYVLYTGELGDALALGDLEHQWRHGRVLPSLHDEVPDLWWPASRAWFVASDTDLEHSTYLGGTHDVVDHVLADPCLDAVVVQPDDPFTPRDVSPHPGAQR